MLELVAKACEGRGTQVNSSSYALHTEQIRFTIHSVLIEVTFGGSYRNRKFPSISR